jgi:hypothetical protein
MFDNILKYYPSHSSAYQMAAKMKPEFLQKWQEAQGKFEYR